MSIRKRIILVIIFVFLVPLLIPLVGYIYLVQPFKAKRITDVKFAPPVVVRRLQKIMESRDSDNPAVSDTVLAVIYEDEGFIYTSPLLREFQKFKGNLWGENLLEFQSTSQLDAIGISTFSYNNKGGMVFYRIFQNNAIEFISNNLVKILFLLTFVLIIIPAVISSIFLLSLRKTFGSLVEGADKIKEGQLDFSLKIPRDKELRPLFTSFEKMREQLLEDNAQKTRFLMAISHDLKTPLTSVKGYLEALEDDMVETEEDKKKYISIIKKKSALLEQRIIELVEFAKMETVNWQKKFIPLNISIFLKNISAIFTAEADVFGKKFEGSIDVPGDILIQGDEQMLYRALENIFDNAVRYTNENVLIKLSAALKHNAVEISIADSGSGIEVGEEAFIFKPFYRGSRGRNEKGFGLGLSSVKSIIEAHGGSLVYRPSELGGAGFVILLPRCFLSDFPASYTK